jgi:predicted FMN-binding regulatory protein PaiB
MLYVNDLTRGDESGFEQPWQANSSSMLKAIVALCLKITDIQCKHKNSQNRILDDQENVAEQFRQCADKALYQAMHQSIQQQIPENKESK